MNPLQITITPTMLTFHEVPDEVLVKLVERYVIDVNGKGRHYIKGTPEQLFKALLELSYSYDLEIS